MKTRIQTTAGLPNRCTQCGAGPLTTWWAETDDHARSGIGYCDKCAQVEPPAEDWEWTGLNAAIQGLLREAGITAAWLRTAPEAEIVALDRLKGIGPGTTRRILKARAA